MTCTYGKCNHDNDEHRDGHCYRITQPEKQGLDKYCPCSHGVEQYRLYETLGFMPVEPIDYMVTKECSGCTKPFLMNLDSVLCMNCKSRNN